ncbi:MAG: phenylacetate--CoA ligase family protein [Gammaproteobacteria bacterium]|nr:phenylacetate--CoA ligase family protein [Gammaproteobacteria bacterium]
MIELRRQFLRNLVLPGAAMLSKTRFLSHYREMRALERRPRADTLAVQRRRLAALLASMQSMPHWRGVLQERGMGPESLTADVTVGQLLARLPVMDKAQLRGGIHDMVREGENREGWQFTNSSGTTERVTIVHDFARRDFMRATQMRAYRIATGLDVGSSSVEIPPDSCNILCGFEDPGPEELIPYVRYAMKKRNLFEPTTIANLRGRFERRVMYAQTTLMPIDPAALDALLQVLDERLDETARHAPMVLRGLPHFLLWMTERAAARGLKLPSVKVILPYGGLMSPVMARRCEQALGAPFRDIYGTSELGIMAVACEHGHLHVFEDLYCIEVLDEAGAAAADGRIGELAITDLTNHAMPVVRYRVGDMGSIEFGRCACGREGQTLVLHGRSAECLRLDGVEPLPARELDDIVFSDRGVWNFRLDQRTRNGFELTLVPAPDAEPDTAALAAAVQARLKLDKPPRVRVRPYIRPEGSGKYRAAAPRGSAAPSSDETTTPLAVSGHETAH